MSKKREASNYPVIVSSGITGIPIRAFPYVQPSTIRGTNLLFCACRLMAPSSSRKRCLPAPKYSCKVCLPGDQTFCRKLILFPVSFTVTCDSPKDSNTEVRISWRLKQTRCFRDLFVVRRHSIWTSGSEMCI